MIKRRAFTLVELLVVIGIIAVLAGLFLSSGKKAREQANGAICANNLRQLAMAFTSYTQDNDDRYPADAGPTALPEDWIYWQTTREVQRSPVLKYVKGDPTRALRCPSDDPDVRKRSGPQIYRYSYTMNVRFSGSRADPATGAKLRQSAVKDPARKIILIEESEASMDDGSWDPTLAGAKSNENYLSTRHYSPPRSDEPTGKLLGRPDRSEKGIVAFADGHSGAITRADTWQPMHYEPRTDVGRDATR